MNTGLFFMMKKIRNTNGRDTSVNVRNYRYIKYSLNFRSLIKPSKVSNLQHVSLLNNSETRNSSKRLLVKQSYLLLTWIFYITKVNKSLGKNTKDLPNFFVKPVKKSRFTITKAPMAHKTFSQEQYGYRFFSINTSFTLFLGAPNLRTHKLSINSALFLILSLRSDPFLFETNLFFIQKLSFLVPSSDFNFLRLF